MTPINHRNINQYLSRINYTGNLNPDAQLLLNLHEQHVLHIPFENLDIHHGVKIELKNTFHKVVACNRGGFCYELNGLFHELLKAIGFDVKMISARVYREEEQVFGIEFDHLCNLVMIDGNRYLVDVGFGKFALQPLKMDLNTVLNDPRGVYWIEKQGDTDLLLKKRNSKGEYVPLYVFTDIERTLPEFSNMVRYHQTSPDSLLTQKQLCTMATTTGRVTLSDNTLTIFAGEHITTEELSDDALEDVLQQYFKISLSKKESTPK